MISFSKDLPTESSFGNPYRRMAVSNYRRTSSVGKYYKLAFYRRNFACRISVSKTTLPTDFWLYGRNMTVGNYYFFCSVGWE